MEGWGNRMLGERLTNLLSLLTQNEPRPLSKLAAKMNLSTKTVRNLVKELNEALQDNGAHVVSKRGEGFMLEVTDLEAFQSLFLSGAGQTPSDSAQRVRFLIEQFLKNDDYMKMDELCEQLYVSRKTLAADIRKAEEFFEEFHLELERKPHYGMRLTGGEFSRRLCMAQYMQKQSGKGVVQGAEIKNAPEDISEEQLIADALLEALEKEEYHISDVGFHSLVLHIAISVKRIRAGQYVSVGNADYAQFIGETEARIARECTAKLEQPMEVVFPEEEIRYLAIHLAGKESNQNLVIDSEIQKLVQEMLQEIYEVFQIDLRDDLELFASLGRHLVPLVIRLKYGMKLRNPLLQEVKKRYSLAYTMAMQACAVLERHYQTLLDSNETAYIALALELSLERHRKQIDKKRVLFVCASGAGTAKLMAYRMQEAFRDYIEEIVTCDQFSIGKQDFSRIDYLFTTVPIREKVPVPIYEVQKILEFGDISGIRHFLDGAQERDILEYYPEKLFFPHLQGETKEEILKTMTEKIREVRPLPKEFYQAVLKREDLARTCMGNQVAMPHPYRVMTEDTFVSVGILEKPVKWDESQWVQAVFLVSVSRKKQKKIQNFYSTTARLLLDEEKIKTLIKERNYETLKKLLLTVGREKEEADG